MHKWYCDICHDDSTLERYTIVIVNSLEPQRQEYQRDFCLNCYHKLQQAILAMREPQAADEKEAEIVQKNQGVEQHDGL